MLCIDSQAARATIFFDAPKATYIIKHDVIDKVNGVAWAVFEDNIETSGIVFAAEFLCSLKNLNLIPV